MRLAAIATAAVAAAASVAPVTKPVVPQPVALNASDWFVVHVPRMPVLANACDCRQYVQTWPGMHRIARIFVTNSRVLGLESMAIGPHMPFL